MRRKYSLPLSSLIPASIAILALWVFFTIFNALRFTQCSSWAELQPPPKQVTTLLGTFQNRLYVKTIDKSVYCSNQNQWAECLLSPYSLNPDKAPRWLINYFETVFQKSTVLQLIRGGNFSTVAYYTLGENGQIFACFTDFNWEVEKIFLSGSFMWLLIPFVLGVWSVMTFINIYINEGSPTFWDFWGKGTKIK
jgi:hypothetical protein